MSAVYELDSEKSEKEAKEAEMWAEHLYRLNNWHGTGKFETWEEF